MIRLAVTAALIRCCTSINGVDSIPLRRDVSATTANTIQSILSDIQAWQEQHIFSTEAQASTTSRPFVIACFAQSLDGQISPWIDQENHENGTASNYPISSKQSLILTHAIRSISDGILIGGKTLSIDNPRLTNRLWSTTEVTTTSITPALVHQPIPIVLDTRLKHVHSLGARMRARGIVACCSVADSMHPLSSPYSVLQCQQNRDNQLNLHDVLHRIRTNLGVRTLMVEGGASILSSFFQQGLVDAVCITVSPLALCGGISPILGQNPVDLRMCNSPKVRTFDSDCIFLSRWPTTMNTVHLDLQ